MAHRQGIDRDLVLALTAPAEAKPILAADVATPGINTIYSRWAFDINNTAFMSMTPTPADSSIVDVMSRASASKEEKKKKEGRGSIVMCVSVTPTATTYDDQRVRGGFQLTRRCIWLPASYRSHSQRKEDTAKLYPRRTGSAECWFQL